MFNCSLVYTRFCALDASIKYAMIFSWLYSAFECDIYIVILIKSYCWSHWSTVLGMFTPILVSISFGCSLTQLEMRFYGNTLPNSFHTAFENFFSSCIIPHIWILLTANKTEMKWEKQYKGVGFSIKMPTIIVVVVFLVYWIVMNMIGQNKNEMTLYWQRNY